MRDLFQRLRVPLLFALFVVLTVTTMVADRRAGLAGGRNHGTWSGLVLDIAAPVQKMIATPGDLVRDVWQRYVAVLDVHTENEALRQRIAELEDANLQFREALVASGHLEQIAEMRNGLATQMLPAEIVGLDVSPWFRSVLLDQGRNRGVQPGMPVIDDEGIVGLVTATSPHASKAMLLVDRQIAIDGVIQRSRVQGIVRGRGNAPLEFEFVVRGGDVRVGDVVITSGLGGVFPKGLRIGEVADVGRAGHLLQTAHLEPAVDFGRLEEVFVMLWRAPTMDLLYAAEEDRSQASAPPTPPVP